MSGLEATMRVVELLEELAVPYMLVGSFSANLYGVPRASEAADFVVEVAPGTIASIADRLRPPLRIDRQVSFETVTMTMRNVISVDESAFTVELFHLRDDPFDRERFGRRRSLPFQDRTAYFPTPEDVIIQKLRWISFGNRMKDVDDVTNVIAVQQANLDWPYVHSWADRHATRQLLDAIRAGVPQID